MQDADAPCFQRKQRISREDFIGSRQLKQYPSFLHLLPPDLLYSCRFVWGTLVCNFKIPPQYYFHWASFVVPGFEKQQSKTDIAAPLSVNLTSETSQTPQDVFLLAVNGLGQFRVLLRESAFDQLLQGLAWKYPVSSLVLCNSLLRNFTADDH